MFKGKKDKGGKAAGGRGDKPKPKHTGALAGMMGMDPGLDLGGDDDFEAELAKITGATVKSGKGKVTWTITFKGLLYRYVKQLLYGISLCRFQISHLENMNISPMYYNIHISCPSSHLMKSHYRSVDRHFLCIFLERFESEEEAADCRRPGQDPEEAGDGRGL